MVQERYWNELYQLKVHVNYVELHLRKAELIDRAMKVFLAFVSSGSIGAWVIWKDLAAVWGVIIAASQVLNAVQMYLPYKERLKALSGLLNDFEELLVYTEMKWFDVASGS